MKGTEPILKAFDGNHKTLFIPVYQRNYDWQFKQCERLFEDLEDNIKQGHPDHFFGAVVGKPDGSWEWVVIDGQQRLTTVSILMLALAHALRDGEITSTDPELAQKIEMDFLRVGSDRESTKFKLKPVKDDDAAYKRLFGPEKEFIAGSNITENYRFFRERLTQSQYTADQFWEAIRSLHVMYLDLEPADDAQRIFESLNSTGLELKEADRIRNFVLMNHDADVQTRLYEDRWNPIEANTGFETDAFIRWYLTTKTASTPKEQNVYEAFKRYVSKRNLDTKDVLEDLYEFSQYFKKIKNAETENKKVNGLLKRINPIRGGVTIPFLMPLLREVENGETTYDDFYNALKMVESFVTRRFVVGLATNSLNKIFASSFSEVAKLRTGDQPYADLFAYTLLRRTGSARFPSDTEFRESFGTKNMYAIRAAWRNYIFDVLENGNSSDARDISRRLQEGEISIEHIMPQTLTPAWRAELGPDAEEIHETWLNRIGNLTVTGYNSSYSNSSFEAKKTMKDGFNDTPYRLNEMVKATDTWGPEELRRRTEAFTAKAMEYWKAPKTSFEPPAAVLPTESMGEEGSFTNREIVSFMIGDFHQTVESWAQMMPVLLNHLSREHRTEIHGFVKDYGPLKIVDAEDETPSGWRRVDDSLIVFTANSTDTKLAFLRGLFEHLELDPDELVFTLRPTKAVNSEDTDAADQRASEEQKANPYLAITKYLDEFSQAETLQGSLESTADLRQQFAQDFKELSRPDAVEILGGMPVGDYLATHDAAQASEAEILATITQILAAADAFGQNYLHAMIVDGTLGRWVGQLAGRAEDS